MLTSDSCTAATVTGQCGNTRTLVSASGCPYPAPTVAVDFHVHDDWTPQFQSTGFQATFTTADDHPNAVMDCHCVGVHHHQAILPAMLAFGQTGPNWLLLPPQQASQLQPQQPLTLTLDPPVQAELVLFDVDGTLVDSLPAYIEVGQQTAAAFGYSMSEQFVRDTMNANNDTFWELIVPAGHPQHSRLVDDLKSHARKLWPRLVQDMVRPFAGTHDYLSELKQRNFGIGVVTASGGSSMQALDEATRDLFDVVVTRNDVSAQKPAPDGIEKAMRTLTTSPNRTVYVGDSLVDVKAAHAAGCACVAVTTGAGSHELLAAAGPRRLVTDLRSLAQIVSPVSK